MILVRVDDFPHTKGEPQHTLDAFRAFNRELNVLTDNKRYLLGVIPKRCNIDDVIFLRNETDCAIGMHGIAHSESDLDRYQNEFPQHMTQLEVRRIMLETKSGMESAIGRRSYVYMPPRNLIDQRTASILNEIGFENYTSGPETDIQVLQRFAFNIHSTFPHEYGRTDEMLTRGSHDVLIERSNDGVVVLTLHWTWETNIGLKHMKEFFSRIPKKHFGDFP